MSRHFAPGLIVPAGAPPVVGGNVTMLSEQAANWGYAVMGSEATYNAVIPSNCSVFVIWGGGGDNGDLWALNGNAPAVIHDSPSFASHGWQGIARWDITTGGTFPLKPTLKGTGYFCASVLCTTPAKLVGYADQWNPTAGTMPFTSLTIPAGGLGYACCNGLFQSTSPLPSNFIGATYRPALAMDNTISAIYPAAVTDPWGTVTVDAGTYRCLMSFTLGPP